ncbi:transmembrane protein 138-like [Pieris napi]|uniref:transmembrane protein 138-like n=1 Tax=Pieris napi TaxID=78633 RepID=UPI001FBA473E|nr:transmembrane protein 138-like [Pieris napi]
MKVSVPRYSTCLVFQMLFMCCDLLFNCWSLFPKSRGGLLLLFFFQDLCLVLAITSILIPLFSTYLFQAGLMEVLIRKFRVAGIVILAYFLLSIALQSAWIIEKWDDTESVSTPLVMVLFTLQRCMAPGYYFFYKRASLMVSDPRFYEDVDWFNQNRTEK